MLGGVVSCLVTNKGGRTRKSLIQFGGLATLTNSTVAYSVHDYRTL